MRTARFLVCSTRALYDSAVCCSLTTLTALSLLSACTTTGTMGPGQQQTTTAGNRPAASGPRSGTPATSTAPPAEPTTPTGSPSAATPSGAAPSEGSEGPPTGTPLEPAPEPPADAPPATGEIPPQPPAPTTARLGAVLLTQSLQVIPEAGTLPTAGAGANFGLPVPNCQRTVEGDCSLLLCTPAEGGSEPTLFAGELAITGLEESLPMMWIESSSGYIGPVFTDFLWSGSQSVTASATGSDEVPAFDIDLDLPDLVELELPALAELRESGLEIARAEDWQLRWSGGGEGDVAVLLGTTEASTRSIECRVPSTRGALAIPGQLLTELAESGASGSLLVRAINTQTERFGEWDIQFSASSNDVQSQVVFGD